MSEQEQKQDQIKRVEFLHIKILKAKLERKTEFMGSDDPYLKLIVGKQESRSTTKSDTQEPEYNEKFFFKVTDEKELKIEVWNANMTSDSINSSLTQEIASIKESDKEAALDLMHEDKKVGTLWVKYEVDRVIKDKDAIKLEEDLQSKDKEIEEHKEKIKEHEELQKKHEELEIKHQEQKVALKESKAKNVELEAELKDHKDDNEKHKDEIDDLKKEHDENKENLEKAYNELKEAQNKNKQLEKELERVNALHADDENKDETLYNKLKEKDDQIHELEDKNEELQKQLDAKTKEADKSKVKNEKLENKNKELKEQLKEQNHKDNESEQEDHDYHQDQENNHENSPQMFNEQERVDLDDNEHDGSVLIERIKQKLQKAKRKPKDAQFDPRESINNRQSRLDDLSRSREKYGSRGSSGKKRKHHWSTEQQPVNEEEEIVVDNLYYNNPTFVNKANRPKGRYTEPIRCIKAHEGPSFMGGEYIHSKSRRGEGPRFTNSRWN